MKLPCSLFVDFFFWCKSSFQEPLGYHLESLLVCFAYLPDRQEHMVSDFVRLESDILVCCHEQDVPSLGELKMAYYHTLIRYHLHFNNYLEISRSYKAMYESEEVAVDPEKWKPVCCS